MSFTAVETDGLGLGDVSGVVDGPDGDERGDEPGADFGADDEVDDRVDDAGDDGRPDDVDVVTDAGAEALCLPGCRIAITATTATTSPRTMIAAPVHLSRR